MNSGFFILDPREDDSDFTTIGDILGLYSLNGEIVKPAIQSRPVLFSNGSKGSIAKIGWRDMVFHLPNGQVFRTDDEKRNCGIRFINRKTINSCFTPRNCEVIEFSFKSRQALACKKNGQATIPNDGFVISLDIRKQRNLIEMFSEGRGLSFSLDNQKEFDNFVQGGIQLIKNHIAVDFSRESELFACQNPSLNTAPITFHKTLERNNKPKMITAVDDRGSISVLYMERGTIHDAIQLLLDHDFKDAMLLDCGGSSQIFYGSGSICSSSDKRDTDFARFDRLLPLLISSELN